VVVILPDSGNRYLSKLFDDNWMRENGFLPDKKVTDTVMALIETRQKLPLVVARSNEEMNVVVSKMNQYDISQLPVVDDQDKLIGMVGEADVLDHLLKSTHIHDPLETIASIINPNVLSVTPDSSIEKVLPAFERGKVVIVINNEGQPVGMLTKIDLIDYLTGKIN